MRYGYARVSSKTQDYSAQVDALKAAGCERIFSEKQSGKSAKDRPEFSKLMRALVPGDTVVVSKLDRLARSSRDLHNILHRASRGRGCGFVSLGGSWCDSTSEGWQVNAHYHGRHCRVRARPDPASVVEEGIERAKVNGKQLGRPAALDHGQRRRVAERYAAGETMAELAREYSCGEATIWRALQ